MPTRAVVTGVDRVLSALRTKVANTGINIDEGLRKCAGVVLRKSYQYVPVETGALKASGRISDNGKKGFATQVKVEYGGPGAFYALYVHEDLTKFHEPPTCAKFLERAVRETRGTCAAILKRTMQAGRGKTLDGVREDITAGNPAAGD